MPRLGAQTDRGAVTAETAVVLPALMAVLVLLLSGVAGGMTQLRLEEAARAGAREVMRGEPPATVEATVQRIAGSHAAVELAADGRWTTVAVSASVPGVLGDVLPLQLAASASALAEASIQSGNGEWP
jgi:Flp pilus assembly protein TadG